MNRNRITVKNNSTVLAMDGKTIEFRLHVDETSKDAIGNGILHATATEETDRMEVSISVRVYPEGPTGKITFYDYYLTDRELMFLRLSADPCCEIECFDPEVSQSN
ncbi:MAG: hypothetical protein WC003_16980 [Terrimicrobiaceae bacterium]